MLPQSPGVDPKTCIPELERCVKEYGFVGINLNPDPSGGHWNSPPLTDRHWYPIYEKMVEFDIPAMIHVSTSCNACFHTTGAHYINADTTAVMQLIEGDLFKDFPTLRFVIPHGGGAAPYHWGRYRGLAQVLKKPLLREHLLKNVFFDTCVYHQPGIDLLTKVIPVDNILFASEMIGAVRGIDPETGHNFDDTKRYIEATQNLSPEDRHKVYEGNARRVYPRLDAALKAEDGRGRRDEQVGMVNKRGNVMHDEPIMDVAHLGHLELLTPKPEESLRFFVDVMGMTESGRQGDSVYLAAGTTTSVTPSS